LLFVVVTVSVMALSNKRNASPPPITTEEDEWGFYDPEKAGLPAVLGRIDAKNSESAASYAARMAKTLRASARPAARPTAAKPALQPVPAKKHDPSK
jgi:hypothetical protein